LKHFQKRDDNLFASVHDDFLHQLKEHHSNRHSAQIGSTESAFHLIDNSEYLLYTNRLPILGCCGIAPNCRLGYRKAPACAYDCVHWCIGLLRFDLDLGRDPGVQADFHDGQKFRIGIKLLAGFILVGLFSFGSVFNFIDNCGLRAQSTWCSVVAYGCAKDLEVYCMKTVYSLVRIASEFC